jgi:hypothetical protein
MIVDAKVIMLQPFTGVAVDAIDVEAISTIVPIRAKFIRFTAIFKYDHKTLAALVTIAKDDKAKLTFYETPFPWIALAPGSWPLQPTRCFSSVTIA